MQKLNARNRLEVVIAAQRMEDPVQLVAADSQGDQPSLVALPPSIAEHGTVWQVP